MNDFMSNATKTGSARREAPAILDTARLRLRPFRESDWDAYAAICADAEVMRYLGTGATLSRDDSWRAIAGMLGHWQLRGYGMWAVESREDGAFVGRVGFLDPPGWPGFELGWVLGRAHWGRGYATEAARAALDCAFSTLRRDRVIHLIRPGNAPSIRVAARLGARRAGELELLGAQAIVYESLP
jgi:RimJ/RimL family protein N-acetyltransferase